MHRIENYLCIKCGHTSEEIEDNLICDCQPPKGKSKTAQRNKLRLINRRNNEFAAIQEVSKIFKERYPKVYHNYLKELK